MKAREILMSVALACALASQCPRVATAAPTEDAVQHPRAVYFTVGDYQDMLYTPLDSKASIEAAFDVMHKLYDVKRVWWRGGQDEIWGKEFLIRTQNRHYERVWNWWMDQQYRVVNTNAIAVKAGHDRGMEVWIAYGLFDNGSPADVGFGGFPYAAEDKIRVEHPEWAPVNKYGTWRQGGPIEFAYPGARKAMVDYFTKYLVDGKYDGIAFLTYVENYSQRYEDEFGYSQPIVDEFKKCYGVDIRTEKFDHDAWAKLRGEYLTQFMRELHASLSKHGIKIAVSTDGKNPNLPCIWNVGGGVRTVGRLWMDVGAWAKEGIVDELSPYYPNTDESLAAIQELCKGTKTTVSAWGRTGSKLPTGYGRVMTIGDDLESGFPWDSRIGWDDEQVTVQPAEALKSDDVYARRRILTAIHRGKQKAPTADVVALLSDPDVYVRRSALRALSTLKDPSSIPAIEKALEDSENGVRWLAAVVLGEMNAPNAVKSMLTAAGRPTGTYQLKFVVIPTILQGMKKTGTLTAEDIQLLVASTASENDAVRETTWSAIASLAPQDAGLENAVLRTLKEDPNAYCRELALRAIGNLPPNDQLFAAIHSAIQKDKDVVVQSRACMALAGLTRSAGATEELQQKAVKELIAYFKQFGTGCQRADKDWGWRECGNALRMLGKVGEASLNEMMANKEDRELAELAWKVLYLRQEDAFCFVTEEEDRQAHAKHPFLKFEAVGSGK